MIRNKSSRAITLLFVFTLLSCSTSSGGDDTTADTATDVVAGDAADPAEDTATDDADEVDDQTTDDRTGRDVIECTDELTTIDAAIPVSGDGSLEAWVRLPEGCAAEDGWPAVVLIHGLGGNRDVPENDAMSYTEAGYVTLAYSVRGQGNSSGPGSYLGPTEREDLRTAIGWLKENYAVDPDAIGVQGQSQGGFHSYAAALGDMGVAAVAPGNYVVSLVDNFLPGQCVDTGLVAPTSSGPQTDFGALSAQVSADLDEQDITGLTTFLEERDLSSGFETVTTPISLQLAWSDSVFKSDIGLEEYLEIGSDKVLFIGVGGHGSGFDMDVEMARQRVNKNWFDHYLRGEALERPTGSVWYAYMDYTDGGDERWVQGELDQWPPTTSDLVLHFTSTGNLAAASEPGGVSLGMLEHSIAADYNTSTLVRDVSTAMARQEVRRVEGRQALEDAFPGTVLTYDSEPFDEPFLWFGTAILDVRVRSSSPFQVAAHVYEVIGSGGGERDILFTTGRLCHWEALPDARNFDVPLEARGRQIRAGSKLRVVLTHIDMSSDTVHTYPLHDAFSAEIRGGTAHPTALTIPVFKP